MPVVPMFHANCWALTFTAPMSGASLVLPGAKLDGASVYELLDRYKVTCTAAVPTVWLMLLQHLEATGSKLPHLERVVIGGSACPRAMAKTFQDVYGVEVVHAWGMTEMSPLGTSCTLKPEYAALGGDARLDIQQKQGHAPFLVEMKITDDAGKRLPWDGKTFGRLKVRGPAVARAYYKEDGCILDQRRLLRHRRRLDHRPPRLHADHRPRQGRDQIGRRMDILDRSREPRRRSSEGRGSGGDRCQASEVGRTAAAGRGSQEGPESAGKDEILQFMQGKVASWWMPDEVVFVDEIPHTATGKIQKTQLREQFKDLRAVVRLPLRCDKLAHNHVRAFPGTLRHGHLRCDRDRGADRYRCARGPPLRFVGGGRRFWQLLARGGGIADVHARHLSVLAHHRRSPIPVVEHRARRR